MFIIVVFCTRVAWVCFVCLLLLGIFVYCVHPAAVTNAAFCMTCNVCMLVEGERGDHMEEAYPRAGIMIAL